MKLLKIRKKKACEDILEYKGHSWRGETYKNFQVEGRLQDQSKCLLMVRCVCLNITGIFHV